MPDTAGTAEGNRREDLERLEAELAAYADRFEKQEQALRGLGDELAATRAALEASEAELLHLRERRSAEMSRLERQAYWLERFGIDLDALMRRRAILTAFTALRLLVRAVRRLTTRR